MRNTVGRVAMLVVLSVVVLTCLGGAANVRACVDNCTACAACLWGTCDIIFSGTGACQCEDNGAGRCTESGGTCHVINCP